MYYFFKRKKSFQGFFVYKWVFLWSILLYAEIYANTCLQTNYSLKLVQKKTNHFELDTQIKITAPDAWRKNSLSFAFYPKRYQEKLPYLHDLNYHRIYPKGFKVSSSQIHFVELNGKIKKIIWEEEGNKRIKQTLFKIDLNPDEIEYLNQGNSLNLVIKATLNLPQKFGAFGYYRKHVALQNAWYPYLYDTCATKTDQTDYLPQQSALTVTVESKHATIINGQYFKNKSDKKTVTLDQTGDLSLRLGPRIREKPFKHTPWLKLYHYKHLNASYLESMQSLALQWQSFVQEKPGLNLPKNIYMVETPMRRFLVKKTESMAFVSDRLFQLNGYLHKYHYIPVVQAWFYQMFAQKVQANESTSESRWVTDALAWYWTHEFLKSLQFKHMDARKMPLLKMFSFLPVVDLIIYSPQFAFVDTFYNNPYPWDYNRDDPVHFYDDRTWGRSLVEKMNDWLGQEKTAKIFQDYLSQSKSLKLMAKEVYEGDIEEAYQQWQFRPPSANYKISKVKSKKVAKNQYQHHIIFSKESKKTFKEPVEILAVDKQGQAFKFKWFDEKEAYKVDFTSNAKLKKTYIDPRSRLSEWQRHDNTKPAPYKFVLEQMLLDYDVNENVPLIFLGGVLRKKLGGYNRYRVSGYYLGESYGVGLGYTRLFGRAVDGLRLSHGASITANFSRVTQDNVLTDSGTLVDLTPASDVSSIGLSYFFGNQLSFTNPLSGGGGAFSVKWGSSALWADHDYINASHAASWVFPLYTINHLLAFRYNLSINSKGIPSQIQPRLGGVTAIKGISFNDEAFQGRYQLLTSAEYRHFLLQDIDINLGLFRIRDIQGAFGLDAGHVTATVQEQAEQIVNSGAQRTGFKDLWKVQDFTYGANYGLRFHIDYFGVNPSVIRFDAARTLDNQHGGIKFYLGFDQSF
ncbi:MAG TPA: hypothetical protein PKC21_03625 [Oligoflexia bacterium]|mgnify:CR=1 FL=1|nr:hypothetical protein [Oligoflexia bacterium]HMR24426.1 hypothetical protein [Oligoflexia bacterium]